MKNKKPQPPEWMLNFFRWYCHPDYAEDIEGDLLERFEGNLEEKGIRAAKWRFFKDVLLLFRPGIIRPFRDRQQLHQIVMIKNNFKIASRHLLRRKYYSLINVLGLSTGLTCCLLIFLYVHHELSYNAFHTKKDRIYRLVSDVKTPTETAETYMTSAPMAAYMKKDFPEIEDMVRLDDNSLLLSCNEQTFQEDNGMFADASFFDVFSFEFIYGNASTALEDPFSIVLTKDAAIKYFGRTNPLGKSVQLDGKVDLKVTGVMQNIPENSSFDFEVLIPVSLQLEKLAPHRAEQWGSFGYESFVLLSKNSDPADVQSKLSAFIEKYAGAFMDEKGMHYTLSLESLNDIYLHSHRGGQKEGNFSNVIIFSIIALFILLIACFNFMNLSTARASERAKEVGIRKTVGAVKSQLIFQFLSESVLLCISAVIIAILGSQLLLPAFNTLCGKQVSVNIFSHWDQIALFSILGIGVGMLAGAYPAFVLSRFGSTSVLKGHFSGSQQGLLLRKVLVVMQFSVSIMLITGTLLVFKQLNFMKNETLGFKKDQMLIIDFRGDKAVRQQIEAIRLELVSSPQVIASSASSSVPGMGNNIAFSELENAAGDMQASNIHLYYVDHDFLDQYNLDIVAGRSFSHDSPSDSTALLVNEATVASYGYQNPDEILGKEFSQWGVKGEIIGVIRNYHFASFRTQIEPLSIRLEPTRAVRYLSLNITSQDISGTIADLQDKWQRLVPHRPFNYFFLDQKFDEQYRSEERFAQLFMYFASIAIFIVCLGLLGLISYTIEQRTKEIGIRKVLGASTSGLVGLLSKDVILLVVLALIISAPIAWMTLRKWLENFVYRIEITGSEFFLAGIVTILITFLTIGFHTIHAAMANPVDSIRSE